ncbi:hypothetical protein PYCCODRAFT_1479403 [Trametes coccinea BRFM310]|uniref:L domain-like protein n=1 Tax=Trametes coccinea (strain BRFM310) TaxID=1353009 RepID=A0A1Y2IG28_TRAC3|nr:hypothetical protein PYCCODRAFT_1479403 [Trametes coccinea BRFM310]
MHSSETYTPSPSSSPSLAPIDSSPPSSPGHNVAICTPPASPGAQDPFAGSTKSNKRPRIYERGTARKSRVRAVRGTPGLDRAGGDDDELTRSIDEADATPTRVLDPFSASAKRAWRPPTYEKKNGRVLSTDSATSASSSTSYAYGTKRPSSPTPHARGIAMMLDEPDDDFVLSDDEWEKPKPKIPQESQEELENRLWDKAITSAIDKVNGIIDLSATSLNRGPITRIPPSVADLEGFVVLAPTIPTSAPSSPKRSPKQLPVESPPPNTASSRPFTRATTVPAAAFNEAFFLKSKDGERLRGTPAARAASLQTINQSSTPQLRRREIQMYLANNHISRLPPELFRVSSLTVLSLRSNGLTSVPPQIAQLASLQELNVSQNKLRWLPFEMLNMRLTKLVVAGNPWIPPPVPQTDITPAPDVRQGSQSDTRSRRPVSQIVVHFTTPPLTELCFRVLLAPYSPGPSLPHEAPAHSPPAPRSHSDPALPTSPTARPLTFLEAAYALPLTEDLCIGPSVLHTLRSCVPAAVAKPATIEHLAGPSKVRRDEGQRDVHSSSAEDVFGSASASHVQPSRDGLFDANGSLHDDDPPAISTCPSPVHHGQARTPVFVQHAEERFTWEEVVAGVRVGSEGVGGVGVPIRWRGCGGDCLAFLDPEPEPQQLPQPNEENPSMSSTSTLAVDVGDDTEMDVDVEDLVGMHEVHFGSGLADPQDFEEGF